MLITLRDTKDWPAHEDLERLDALDAPWAIGSEAMSAVRERLALLGSKTPLTIVEFGGGVSTAALARAFPRAHILSIDHDPRFLEATRLRVAGTRVEVSLRPLTWQDHGEAPYLSYEAGAFPEMVDAVLVDGPPHWTRGGREATLYQVFDRLKVGGLVILDDHRRRRERRIVEHWLEVYRGSLELVEVLEVGHHLAVLRKTDALAPSWEGRRRFDAKVQAGLQPLTATLRRVALGLRGCGAARSLAAVSS